MNAVVFFLGVVIGLGGGVLLFVAAARVYTILLETDWSAYEEGDIRLVRGEGGMHTPHNNNSRKE